MQPIPPSNPSHVSIPLNLANDLLHIKPVSHRFFGAITHISTKILQKHSQNPHAIRLAKAIVLSGYALNMLVIAIEFIAALALSILANAFHLSLQGRSEWVEKITLKICAYCINVFFVAGIQVVFLHKRLFSPYQTLNSLVNEGLFLASAVVSQLVIGHIFDEMAGRNPSRSDQLTPSGLRTIQLVMEAIPSLVQEASNNALIDFAVHIQNNPQNQNIQAFLQNHPEHASLVRQLSFERIRNDPAYRSSLLLIVGEFLIEAGIFQHLLETVSNVTASRGQVEQTYGLSRHPEDMKYKKMLIKLVKESFIELYNNDDWVSFLDKDSDVKNGREQLTTYMALGQLANFAQLREIEEEICCPETFHDHALGHLNPRKKNLEDARKDLEKLKAIDEEKLYPILIKKLLKTSDLDLSKLALKGDQEELIQKLFNTIGKLAADLHQGRLLTEQTVSLNLLINQPMEAFSSKHLFQIACEEAQKELKLS